MRVIVFGSRTYDNRRAVYRFLNDCAAECVIDGESELIIVNGLADGADALGRDWAKAQASSPNRWPGLHIDSEDHPADWNGPCDLTSGLCQPGHRRKRRDGSTWCPTAGFRRNGDMADLGAAKAGGFVDGELAKSRGTRNMHHRCKSAGIKVDLFDRDGEAIEQRTATGRVL